MRGSMLLVRRQMASFFASDQVKWVLRLSFRFFKPLRMARQTLY